MNGPEAISAIVEHLQLPDLEILLSNRGLPSIGTKDELKGRVHAAFKDQFCPYEWERGAVPTYHAGKCLDILSIVKCTLVLAAVLVVLCFPEVDIVWQGLDESSP